MLEENVVEYMSIIFCGLGSDKVGSDEKGSDEKGKEAAEGQGLLVTEMVAQRSRGQSAWRPRGWRGRTVRPSPAIDGCLSPDAAPRHIRRRQPRPPPPPRLSQTVSLPSRILLLPHISLVL